MKAEAYPQKKTSDGKGLVHIKDVFGELIRNKTLYLMALPGLLCFLLFNYFPMVGSIIAFKDFNFTNGFEAIFTSPFMKPLFKNFEFLLSSGYAWRITRNTIVLNAEFIFVGILFQVGLAIILNEVKNGPFRKMIQSFTFLPYFISWIVLGVFIYNLLNYDTGVINGILAGLGLEKYDFYSEPKIWPFLMNVIYAWKNTGYGIVIYLAVISGFDGSLYEAAEIDGASKIHQVFHITLPLLTPTILVLLLMNIGGIMNADFGMFYAVVGNNSILFPTVDVIDTFVYRALRQSSDIGMSSAAGFFQSCLAFIIVMISNKLVKKYQEDGALF